MDEELVVSLDVQPLGRVSFGKVGEVIDEIAIGLDGWKCCKLVEELDEFTFIDKIIVWCCEMKNADCFYKLAQQVLCQLEKKKSRVYL